MLMSFFITCFY